MTDEWQYQIRINLDDALAKTARDNPDDAAIAPLATILKDHDARMKSQYDAFADYVAEAEARGVGDYPLYQWTKDTIEDPAKKEKYLKSFTLYVGGDEVYAKDKADALEAALQALADRGMIARLSKHDTNPANNPQPPKRYRK